MPAAAARSAKCANVSRLASISAATSTYGIRARSAASITGAAVVAKGPAQLTTASAPVSARSREAGSSTVAGRTPSPGREAASARSLPSSRPARTGVNPRSSSSATTNRPVCPYAPKTATTRPVPITALPPLLIVQP